MYDQTPENKPATAAVLWTKGTLIGQKPPLTRKQIWAIRIRLQMDRRLRDLALFNLAIDSKLRGCDLVRLRVRPAVHGEGRLAGDGDAAQDRAAGALRGDRADPRCGAGLDR